MSSSDIAPETCSATYALMSLTNPANFWGFAGTEDCFGPMNEGLTRTYTADEVSDINPGEDCIFVEILNYTPGFPCVDALGEANRDLLMADLERWTPRLNDLFYDPYLDDFTRLVGIHIDQNDFYFRLRQSDGKDSFMSMAIRLDPASERLPGEAIQDLDKAMKAQGCQRQESFLVTREVDKPWPRKEAAAAFIQILGQDRSMIFGPFESPVALKEFKDSISKAPGYSFTTSWTEVLEQSKNYAGHNIPEEIWSYPQEDVDIDQLLEIMMTIFTESTDEGPVSISLC